MNKLAIPIALVAVIMVAGIFAIIFKVASINMDWYYQPTEYWA